MEADFTGIAGLPPTTVNYNAPVVTINGDRAQLAWNNGSVSQQQDGTAQMVAPGFERVAEAMADVIRMLPGVGLSADDQSEAVGAAEKVLAEVVAQVPDEGRIRRDMRVISGILAPVATGAGEGGGQELAKLIIGVVAGLVG